MTTAKVHHADATTIIIIDDNRIARMVLRNALRDLPQVDIIEAVDGLAAWEKLESGLRPDLAIIDRMMPRMDGVELIQKIRFSSLLRNLRIIMCTVIKERYRMAEVLSLDISSYVIKPFSSANLMEEVLRALKPAINSGLLSAQAEARSQMIIDYYGQKLRNLTAEADKGIAILRVSMATGDRSGAVVHLAVMRAAASKNGLDRMVNILAQLETRIFQKSEMELSHGIDLIEAESKKVCLAVESLDDPKVRKDFLMDCPSTATLHRRFVHAYRL